MKYQAHRFSTAPMMDWTDRHCRFLHRQLTKRALLFTEMIPSAAIIHGDHQRLLGYDQCEHPVALQLGGSDSQELAEATRICTDFGYDEINLNVGCPSDRVQSGRFGACLMAEPDLVARCIQAMKAATEVPITVKCRIGIDDQDPEIALNTFADAMADAGVDALYVHARKAWLQGLSPKENRDIPPLDYPLVYALAERLSLPVLINGGITTLDDAEVHLKRTSGVMLGRAAYYNSGLLREVDQRIFGADTAPTPWEEVRDAMIIHAEQHIASGGRLVHVTRHMVGLFQGKRGARRFRQILSTEPPKSDAASDIITRAFAAVEISETSDRPTAA